MYIDEREIGKIAHIRVFKKTHDNEREEVDVLVVKPGQEYCLYSHGKDNILHGKKRPHFWWSEPWMVDVGENRNSCDPHACLRKDQQCNLCPYIQMKDGRNVGRINLEPHRSLPLGTKCCICSFSKGPTDPTQQNIQEKMEQHLNIN